MILDGLGYPTLESCLNARFFRKVMPIPAFAGTWLSDRAPRVCGRRRYAQTKISNDQPLHRSQAARIGEHRVGEHACRRAELIGEHALQHGAEIYGWLEVAAFMELGVAEPRRLYKIIRFAGGVPANGLARAILFRSRLAR